jgi:hypothetical protein
MYTHVHTFDCTYHVRIVYRCVYTFLELYKHVHTCLYISGNVHICLYHVCTVTTALSVGGTYMVQTCLYTFMPGGQDSRWDDRRSGGPRAGGRGTRRPVPGLARPELASELRNFKSTGKFNLNGGRIAAAEQLEVLENGKLGLLVVVLRLSQTATVTPGIRVFKA